jgi:hypothetical protein
MRCEKHPKFSLEFSKNHNNWTGDKTENLEIIDIFLAILKLYWFAQSWLTIVDGHCIYEKSLF